MGSSFRWLKNNLSHFFAILGIIATVYFAIFYVPDWVQESKNERIRNVNEGILELIQELIYNNQSIDIRDLNTLIRGKELRYNIQYPYTHDELLIQAQERFLDNNFIPLNERKRLSEKIDSLRAFIKPDTLMTIQKATDSDWPSIALVALSLLVGISSLVFGSSSIITKLRAEKQVDVLQKVEQKEEEIGEALKNAVDFERLVGEVLHEVSPYPINAIRPSIGADFEINSPNGTVAVEVKYRNRAHLPSHVIEQMRAMSQGFPGGVILVSNVPLTHSADQRVQIHEMASHSPVMIVVGRTREELVKEFTQLFRSLTDE